MTVNPVGTLSLQLRHHFVKLYSFKLLVINLWTFFSHSVVIMNYCNFNNVADPCQPNPCLNNGVCAPIPNDPKSFECICPLNTIGEICNETRKSIQ